MPGTTETHEDLLERTLLENAGRVRELVSAAVRQGTPASDIAVLLVRLGDGSTSSRCATRQEIPRQLARERGLPWETLREIARDLGGAGPNEVPVIVLLHGPSGLWGATRLASAATAIVA